MALSDIVRLPKQLRAPCYECGRICTAPEACTAPCGQGPLHRLCLQRHVNNCNDSASCELPEPEPHQNIAAQAGAKTASSSQLYVKCPSFCGKVKALECKKAQTKAKGARMFKRAISIIESFKKRLDGTFSSTECCLD